MAINESKKKIVIDNYFRRECSVNTSIKEAFTKGFELGLKNAPIPRQKYGKWIKHDTGHSIYYDCSLCGCAAPCTETADKLLWKMANYCPDCGARMEGDNNE